MDMIKTVQVSDKEFLIDKTIVKIREDGIVYIEAHGSLSTQSARQHLDYYHEIGIICDKKRNFLINLNDAGKNSSGARKVWQNMGKLPSVVKVAFYGLHPVAKVLASFLIGLNRRRVEYFFSSEEEALKWLRK